MKRSTRRRHLQNPRARKGRSRRAGGPRFVPWEMGLEDTQRTLRHKQWLTLPTNADGVTIHDLHREDPT